MASPPEKGELKEGRDKDNDLIIIDSTLLNILPPQLKSMTSRCKIMGMCECCINGKIYIKLSYQIEIICFR